MKERLQQLMEIENLTPSNLAERIDVQRSGISHILSGRNNPSYDFILKLINSFPNLNSEWLITGKGSIYKNEEDNYHLTDKENVNPQKNSLFTSVSESPKGKIEINSTNSTLFGPKAKLEIANSSIERVILFFKDGSFKEYSSNRER